MSNADLTSILFVLLLLVGLAQLLGYAFVKLRQPKVVGEILAGVVLGPALLGRLPVAAHFMDAAQHQASVFNFVYWLGLLLLMFLSGAETRQLFTRDERREVAWLSIVGSGAPFLLALALGPWLIRPALAGPNGNRLSLIIILAVGVAVTSVPVVSKIFADLKILHTRFARGTSHALGHAREHRHLQPFLQHQAARQVKRLSTGHSEIVYGAEYGQSAYITAGELYWRHNIGISRECQPVSQAHELRHRNTRLVLQRRQQSIAERR